MGGSSLRRRRFFPLARTTVTAVSAIVLGASLQPAYPVPQKRVASSAVSWTEGEEVVSLRDRWGSTVRGATPGEYVSTIHSKPVNYQATDGSWQPIDLTVRTTATGLRPTANDVVPVLGLLGSDSDLVDFGLGQGRSIRFGLAGALRVPGIASGSSVRYPSILSGVDARYDLRPGGVKETLVLASAAAPTVYDFPLDLTGVTAHTGDDGAVGFVDASGETVAVIPPGEMHDSSVDLVSGDPVSSSAVTYQLVPGAGADGVLRVSISGSWLHDPARVFPVEIDPSVYNVAYAASSDDSYVQSTGGYSYTDTLLKSGTFDGNDKSRSFMHFQSVNTFDGRAINSATLNLWENWSYSCTTRGVRIYPISTNWDGTVAMSWAGAGVRAYSSAYVPEAVVAHGYNSSCPAANVAFNVTQTVKYWANNTWPNYGLAIISTSETDAYGWKKWDSANGTHDPSLTVNWTNSAPGQVFGRAIVPNDCASCSGPTNTKDTTPVLKGSTTDPDAQLLRYDFEVYPGLLTTVDGSGNATPGSATRVSYGSVSNMASGASASWTVPSALADGYYSYRVRAYDGELYGVWSSGWAQFTVESLPPPSPTITSSTHPNETAYYSAATIDAAWQSVALSGMNGYTTVLDTVSGTDPGTSNPSPVESGEFASEPDGCFYLHTRPLNNVGTWGAVSQKRMCIDTANPNPPSTLSSSSHLVNGPSNNTVVSLSGSGATDVTSNGSASGIGGYSIAFSTSSTTPADMIQDVAGTTFSVSSPSLADGTWYAHVRAIDLAGNASADAVSGPYLIDTLAPGAPTPTSAQATSGTWTSATTVQFTWAAPADVSGITGYAAVLDDLQNTVPPMSVTTTSPTLTYNGIAEGTHYFHLRAVDKAGNWGATYQFTLLVDSSAPLAPTVTSTTHPNQSQWVDNDAPAVSFSGTDLSGVTGLSYSIDTSASTVPDTTVEVSGSSGNASYTGRPEGVNYFHVRSRNGSGLFGDTYHYTVRIDRSAPNVAPTVTSTTHSPGVASNNQALNLTWAAAPGSDQYSGVVGYSVAINTSAGTPADTTQDQTGTTFAYTMPADGDYYFHVRAIDALGHVGTDAVTGPWRLDLTVPGTTVITSSTHPQNTWVSTTGGLFSLSAPDANGIGGYSVVFDENATTTPPATVNSGSSYSQSAIADGTHYLHARAKDAAGNWGGTSAYTVLVDATGPAAPSVSSSTNPSQTAWSTTNAPGFTFNGNDLSGINGWSYVLDRTAGTIPDAVLELGAGTSGSASFTGLADGLNYFHVRAVNGAGVLGATTTYTVKVDRSAPEVAPTVTSSTHQVNVPINQTSLQLAWTAAPGSDAYSGIAGYSIAVNTSAGTAADSTIDLAGTTYSSTLPGEGTYYVHIRAIDALGNVGGDTVTGPYVIDLTSPLAAAVSSATHSQTVWTTNQTATLTWTIAADPSGIAGYSVIVDQVASTVPPTTVNQTLASTTTSVLPDGISYLHVRGRDGAGNWGPASHYTLLVDATAPAVPTITSSTHANQAQWYSNDSPALTLVGSDVSGITGYSYTLDQNPSGVPDTTIDSTTGSVSFSGLSDGVWYVHARAVNGSALVGGTSTFTVRVDRTAPSTAVLTSGTHEPYVLTNHRVATVDWTDGPSLDPLAGLAGYSVALNAADTTPADTVVDSAATSFTTGTLSDGTYWLHVRPVDTAGNVGTDAAFGPIVIDATHGLPYPVQDVLATAGDGTATVLWSPVDDNGSAVLGYTVTAEPDGATLDVGPLALTATFTGLENGTPYAFTVAAHNANGDGLESERTIDVTPFGHVGSVADVQVEEIPYNAVRVSWVAPDLTGGTDSDFTVTLNPGGITRTVSLVSEEGDSGVLDPFESTSTLFTGLAPGTYTATVVPSGDDGVPAPGITSDPVVVRGALPAAPTGLTAVPGDAQVTLAWVPAIANGSPVTQYEVVVNGDESTVQYVDGTDTTFVVSELANGVGYTFDVFATNDLGRSTTASRASAVPVDTGVGDPASAATPSNLRATRGDHSAHVTWTAPTASAPGVTGYQVTTHRTDGSVVKTTPATGNSVTVTGLTNGVPVYFTVATTAGPVVGPESNRSNTVTPAGPPGIPTGVSVTSVESALRVTWTKPSANGDPIRNYLVQIYSTSSGYIAERRVGMPAQNITGLTYGTTYYVTVKAQNGVGTSAASTASNSAKFKGVPTAPTSPVATQQTPTSLQATWSAATARGDAITKYVVTAEPGGRSATTSDTATSGTVTGLTRGVRYRLHIAAYSAMGRGKEAVTGWVTLKDTPGAPTNLKAKAGDHSITVTWSAANAHGAYVQHYNVYTVPGYTGPTVSGDKRSATIAGLTNGTSYRVYVYADNSEGNGPSGESNAVTPAAAPPPPPPPSQPPASGGGSGSGGAVRDRIAKRARSMDQQHRAMVESPGGNCNWFTGTWGRGSSVGDNSAHTPCADDSNAPATPRTTRSEMWCADFAGWVWKSEGVNVGGGSPPTNALANSFAAWAQDRGTWHPAGSGYVAKPGDAAVWKLPSGSGHVGIVVQFNSDRSMYTVNGNAGPANDNGENVDTYYKKNPYVSGDRYKGRGTFQGWASPVDSQGRVVTWS